MVTITINNNKCQLDATIEEIHHLRKDFRIRAAGAWFSQAYRNRTWDGFTYYVTEAGYFQTGLLPKIIDWLERRRWRFQLNDNRRRFKAKEPVLQWKEFKLRPYQAESVKAVLNNKVHGVRFTRGILDEATNAGKSMIAASIFKSFADDKKFIFIVNRQHLYEQLKVELGKLVGWMNLGCIGGSEVRYNRFMICMAQTLAKNYHKYSSMLHQFDGCIIDECHYASSKTYKDLLQALDNCYVKIGMSGTPLKHKDKNKNEKILSFFGPTLHKTTNDDLIRLGFSTKPIITILPGNTLIRIPGDYKEEETRGLIKSKERNGQVIKRVRQHIGKGRIPLLIICKFHNHTELMYRKVIRNFPELRVDFIHVKVKNRLQILKRFKKGKLDILVSSKLIKEGQNIPEIRALTLACGGDSVIDVVQIVGRALRKAKSKKRVYIDDFKDEGAYLKRHSKHRLNFYKDEKFKIIDRTIK